MNASNFIDLSFYIINFAYAGMRFATLDKCYSPLSEKASIDDPWYVRMILLNLALLTFSIKRMMSYLRVYQGFGQLVLLLWICVNDVMIFSVFLFMWICSFTTMYMIVGLEVADDDYKGLSRGLRTFI